MSQPLNLRGQLISLLLADKTGSSLCVSTPLRRQSPSGVRGTTQHHPQSSSLGARPTPHLAAEMGKWGDDPIWLDSKTSLSTVSPGDWPHYYSGPRSFFPSWKFRIDPNVSSEKGQSVPEGRRGVRWACWPRADRPTRRPAAPKGQISMPVRYWRPS